MYFSLIIGTLNRSNILKICLNKIEKQTFRDFEVIIIDQSKDNLTETMLAAEHYNFPIVYRHICKAGLSNARNIALNMAKGKFFCLIDDDGLYDSEYLLNAYTIYEKNKDAKIILTGVIWDLLYNKFFVDYSKMENNKKLSIREIIRNCPSAALIIPYKAYKKIGGFDIRFGSGAEFGAAEETDFLLSAIQYGYTIMFNNALKVQHPITEGNTLAFEMTPIKARKYSQGIGALYKKHMILNKKYVLLTVYWERWIKLNIKKLISCGMEKELIENQLSGTKEGMRKYT